MHEARSSSPDPGNRIIVEVALSENRILITMDKVFGELIYLHGDSQAGLIRLPDVWVARRNEPVGLRIDQYHEALQGRAIVTVQGGSVRIYRSPKS